VRQAGGVQRRQRARRAQHAPDALQRRERRVLRRGASQALQQAAAAHERRDDARRRLGGSDGDAHKLQQVLVAHAPRCGQRGEQGVGGHSARHGRRKHFHRNGPSLQHSAVDAAAGVAGAQQPLVAEAVRRKRQLVHLKHCRRRHFAQRGGSQRALGAAEASANAAQARRPARPAGAPALPAERAPSKRAGAASG
jgi:hypothetical protein